MDKKLPFYRRFEFDGITGNWHLLWLVPLGLLFMAIFLVLVIGAYALLFLIPWSLGLPLWLPGAVVVGIWLYAVGRQKLLG